MYNNTFLIISLKTALLSDIKKDNSIVNKNTVNIQLIPALYQLNNIDKQTVIESHNVLLFLTNRYIEYAINGNIYTPSRNIIFLNDCRLYAMKE